jgi:holo-[acyl-carrier protein] synthase
VSAHVLTGVDLVEVDRFRDLNPAIRKRFYERVFTPEERNHIGASLQRAAGLFAAKEAAVKALGCGIGPVSWQEVRVRHNPQGLPYLEMAGAADRLVHKMEISSWSLSITHTRDLAAAVAVALIE